MFSEKGIYWYSVAFALFLGRFSVMAALSSHEKDEMLNSELPHLMECLDANGLSLEKFEETMENLPDGYYCFLDCFYKKLKIFDEQGMYNLDQVMKNIKLYAENEEDFSKIEETAKNCEKINEVKIPDGDENCERAKLLSECLDENKSALE